MLQQDDITSLSISNIGGAIASGEMTTLEVTEAHLERIARLQPQINCFIASEPETARSAADSIDRAIARNGYQGSLQGVPLAHKDVLFRTGVPVTSGMRVLDAPSSFTATLLERLDSAGAVNLGRLNLDEFAGLGKNEHFGRCINPWSAAHISGGSSSGPGVAVAARLACGAIGSDAGGSIRMPAAMCGVVGLKPTFGLVSRYGNVHTTWSVDCLGPLTRTVEDCATVLQAIAGWDPEDPTTVNARVPDYRSGYTGKLEGIRIGWAVGEPFDAIEDEVAKAIFEALDVFRDLGAEIIDLPVPRVAELNDLQQVLTKAERATIYSRALRDRPDQVSFTAHSVLYEGFLVPATRYLEAVSLRATLLQEHLAAVHGEADVLITPVIATPVPTIADIETADADELERIFTRSAAFVRFASYLGIPGMSVPCGFTSNGLPTAFQLLGPPFSEGRLFQVGNAYQQATSWHTMAPPL
tara:strand:+ start:248 stop:1657 length:1410 start_codon:yes stop_codon:yes gene_type:complete